MKALSFEKSVASIAPVVKVCNCYSVHFKSVHIFETAVHFHVLCYFPAQTFTTMHFVSDSFANIFTCLSCDIMLMPSFLRLILA
jgi:hypothetical protein